MYAMSLATRSDTQAPMQHVINASSVAAAAGLHPYKSADEALAVHIAKLTGTKINSFLYANNVPARKAVRDALVGAAELQHESAKHERDAASAAVIEATDSLNLALKTAAPKADFVKIRADLTSAKRTLQTCENGTVTAAARLKRARVGPYADVIKETVAATAVDKHDAVSVVATQTLATAAKKMDAAGDTKTAERIRLAAREIEQRARMQHGATQESADLNLAEHNLGSIKHRNAHVARKILQIGDGMAVALVGRADGLDNQGRVVEAKRRRNRLFNKVPAYEQVQVMVYMYLTYTGDLTSQHALLVETFGCEQQTHNVQWCGALWGQVIAGLKRFVSAADNAIGDPDYLRQLSVYRQHPKPGSAPKYICQ